MDTGYGFILPGFSSISKATGAGAGEGNMKPLKVLTELWGGGEADYRERGKMLEMSAKCNSIIGDQP